MVERLGWTLVHFVWEGATVAGLLALALLAARRSASNLRYGLALGALVLLAALPFATFLALTPRAVDAVLADAPRWTPGVVISAGPTAYGPMPILVGAWVAGVVLLSLRLAGTLLHLERWRRRHAHPADPDAQARLDALGRRLGLRRRVALFLSDRLEVPSAWGVLRPVIVLPASLLLSLSLAQTEAVLLHELAHVRRHDYLVNLLQSVVETALFYHPAVWWVSSVVRREREHVCDDLVVDALGDPAPYARALLLLEERRRAPRPALSAKEGKLMDRIARILAPRPAPVRLSPLAPALAALAVVGLALGGVLRAEAQATPPPTPKKPDLATPPKVADARRMGPEEIALVRGLEVQQQALAAQRATLLRQWARSQEKGHTDAARQRAEQAQIQVLRAQLEALRARERALHNVPLPNSATFGVPGKAAHPIWKAQSYPHGVGLLVDPAAPDTRAFTAAQAALARTLGIGSSAQRTAVRKATDRATAQQIATLTARQDISAARQQVTDLYWKTQAASTDAARKTSLSLARASAARISAEKAQLSGLTYSQARTLAKSFSSAGLPQVDIASDRTVSIDVDHGSFADTVRALAKKAKLSIVIEMGVYYDVTAVLNDVSVEDAMEILAKAGHASLLHEGNHYWITSKVSAPPSGGLGGGVSRGD